MNPIESLFRPAVLLEHEYKVTEHICQVKLNQNENPYSFPAELKAEIETDLLNAAWNRYPTVFPDHFISQLAGHFGVLPENLLIGHGSNELIYSSLWAILGHGEKILIPEPSFSLYKTVANLCEALVVPVLSNPETLKMDLAELAIEIHRHQPKLTILCSPNNPSSQRIPYDDLISLLKMSEGLVWVDEAYIEFSENQSLVDRLNEFPNLIILRTFSKAYGLAGLRLGFLVSSAEIIRQLRKTKVPFTVDEMSQIIASKILKRMDLVDRNVELIKTEKARIFAILKDIKGIQVFESDTNFFIFKVLKNPLKSVFASLVSEGILVRDVSSYTNLSGCLRVNVGTPEENDQFLTAIKTIVS